MNDNIWSGKKVFITGHTGFKGSWLSLFLKNLGAEVFGYSLRPSTNPNLYELLNIEKKINQSYYHNIRDSSCLKEIINEVKPDIVFHLAAQPLVRQSYLDPNETWDTNVMGSLNLLEAVRECHSVNTLIIITSDKCYKNNNQIIAYRETDRLGGYDPYSASKACVEILVDSYRQSFFSNRKIAISTARGGNVIGGGDWSVDRIVPDATRSILNNSTLMIRNPYSTRPWQHVLDAINGYLHLAERMQTTENFPKAINIGPDIGQNRSVIDLIEKIKNELPQLNYKIESNKEFHEANNLFLDTTYAKLFLNWKPKWDFNLSVYYTAKWYKAFINDPKSVDQITQMQINEYMNYENE